MNAGREKRNEKERERESVCVHGTVETRSPTPLYTVKSTDCTVGRGFRASEHAYSMTL